MEFKHILNDLDSLLLQKEIQVPGCLSEYNFPSIHNEKKSRCIFLFFKVLCKIVLRAQLCTLNEFNSTACSFFQVKHA